MIKKLILIQQEDKKVYLIDIKNEEDIFSLQFELGKNNKILYFFF